MCVCVCLVLNKLRECVSQVANGDVGNYPPFPPGSCIHMPPIPAHICRSRIPSPPLPLVLRMHAYVSACDSLFSVGTHARTHALQLARRPNSPGATRVLAFRPCDTQECHAGAHARHRSERKSTLKARGVTCERPRSTARSAAQTHTRTSAPPFGVCKCAFPPKFSASETATATSTGRPADRPSSVLLVYRVCGNRAFGCGIPVPEQPWCDLFSRSRDVHAIIIFITHKAQLDIRECVRTVLLSRALRSASPLD